MAQHSSTGSEWINWHTFNWEGSSKRPGLIALVESCVFPYAGKKGARSLDADGVELVDTGA